MVGARGRARHVTAISADQGAVDVHVGVPGGAGGQQRAAQPRRPGGEGVDALVQIPVGRRAADPIVGGQLGQPGAVEKPAQQKQRLPVAAQRTPTPAGATTSPFGGQQGRHEQHGLVGCGEHGGVGDRIGHGRTSVMDICERTSLLPGSCVCLGHPAAIGVSPVVPATDNTSLTQRRPS
jgi:hypothetical protein